MDLMWVGWSQKRHHRVSARGLFCCLRSTLDFVCFLLFRRRGKKSEHSNLDYDCFCRIHLPFLEGGIGWGGSLTESLRSPQDHSLLWSAVLWISWFLVSFEMPWWKRSVEAGVMQENSSHSLTCCCVSEVWFLHSFCSSTTWRPGSPALLTMRTPMGVQPQRPFQECLHPSLVLIPLSNISKFYKFFCLIVLK